ncbi:MAG TPA: DUF2180 family protein [Symbiobacteriaceae bacterium]
MQCYDCAKQGVERAAVTICRHCGAALCLDHAQVAEQPVTVYRPVYKVETLPVKARQVLCRVCKEALEQPR